MFLQLCRKIRQHAAAQWHRQQDAEFRRSEMIDNYHVPASLWKVIRRHMDISRMRAAVVTININIQLNGCTGVHVRTNPGRVHAEYCDDYVSGLLNTGKEYG